MSATIAQRIAAAAARVAEDLDAVIDRDPSIRSRGEAALHPTMPAVLGHRVASRLYRRGMFKSARALSMGARLVSGGIEIHPGAEIGRRFFIDHGAAVVIGETAIIGDDVTLFHQVTLGSTGWWNDRRRGEDARRHPRLGNGVTIGANASVLGPVTVGDNAMIGAQSLVLGDVPQGARVHAPRGAIIERDARRPERGHLRLAPSPDAPSPDEQLQPAAAAGGM